MAWNSRQDEALNIIGQHMFVMRPENKLALSETYSWSIFGSERNLVRWTMRYYMLQEHLGLGPSKYCVQSLSRYESRVLYELPSAAGQDLHVPSSPYF